MIEREGKQIRLLFDNFFHKKINSNFIKNLTLKKVRKKETRMEYEHLNNHISPQILGFQNIENNCNQYPS